MSKILSYFRRQHVECSLTELLAPHITRLYRQAYKYGGTEHEAEELIQELLIECSEREQQLREAPVPAAWLSRVLYHRFVDRHRKLERHNHHLDVDEQQLSSASSPEGDYLHQQLLSCLDTLSPEQRMVISLHDIEGYSLVEISDLMDIPVGTLKSHLHRGRKCIKNSMQLQPNELAVR